jgi:large subunit ribosomal protein L18
MQAKKKKYTRRKRIVRGDSERPRLVVFRSNNNIVGQIVDDSQNRVLMGLSTLDPELRAAFKEKDGRVSKAKMAGKKLGEKALSGKIKRVVFDRNGYLYHGRVKAFAEGAREAGLDF